MGQPQSKNAFATAAELPDLTAFVTVLDYIKGGGQADVRKARIIIKNESKIVAVKQLRRTEEAMKLAQLEMKMWCKASGHTNVVQLLGKIVDPRNFPSMVSEFCEQGDLLSYTFSVARFNYKDLLCDILQGLIHIHQLNLAHGDLKPENVVLTAQSKRLTAKICDFGSTRDVLSKGHISLEYTCTALYRSPELSTEEDVIPSPSFEADVWAFGCVAFVVLCKKLPYHWVKNRWTIDIFIASRKLPHSEDDKWPEASLRHIVQSCWCDMAIRPSAAALLRRMTSTASAPPNNQLELPSIPLPSSRRHKYSPSPSTRSAQSSRPSRRAQRPYDGEIPSAGVIPMPVVQPYIPSSQMPPPAVLIPPPSRHVSTLSSTSLHSPSLPSPSLSSEIYHLPSEREPSEREPSEREPSEREPSTAPSRATYSDRDHSQPIRTEEPPASSPHVIRAGEPQAGPQIIRIGSPSPSTAPTISEGAEDPAGSEFSLVTGSPSLHDQVSDLSLEGSVSFEQRQPLPPVDESQQAGRPRIISMGSRSGSPRSPGIIHDSPVHTRRSWSRSRSPAPVVVHIDDAPSRRRHARSRSPRVIEIGGTTSRSRRSRSRSHSPTRIVHVGGTPSPSRRSRSHSPVQIIVVPAPSRRTPSRSPPRIIQIGSSRSRRSRSHSRSPTRIVGIEGPRRGERHGRARRSRSFSRSRSRSRSQRRPVSPSTRRPIVIDINIMLESDDPDHEPRHIRQTVRVPMPPRRARRPSPESPREHRESTAPRPVVIPPSRDTGSSRRAGIYPGPQSPIRPALQSPETRDRTPAPSSSAVSEIDHVQFPYQASYTRLRRELHNGRMVVKKSLRRSSTKYAKTAGAIYLNYTQDMFNLRHKHLVDIHGVAQGPSTNDLLIMESYPTNLLAHRGSLDYQNQLRVFCEVLEGLQALHTSVPPIAHQCLKASNIMIDGHGSAKLSLMNSEPYLAFSCEPSPTRSYSSNWPRASRWWSPNVFRDKTKLSTVENDIWAFGCVVLEVLTGSIPYPNFQEDASLVSHIQAGHSPDSGLRRAPKLGLWKDVRRCWSSPRPTTAYMLNLLCDYLAREVMRDVPDLTGQVAKSPNTFVRGRSADIYSGIYTNRQDRSQRISVVAKQVRSNHGAQRTDFLLWLGGCAQNRKYFDHKNICTLLGVMYSARLGPLFVFEYHAGGNLSDYMRTNGGALALRNKFRIVSDILEALVHLHERHNTAWGDLHPANIVLDHNGSPKLCGLGPRTSLHHEAASQNDLAVLRYFAPERFQPETTSPHMATDIWAFGCLILMVLSGYEPYREIKSVYRVARDITSGRWPYGSADCGYHSVWVMASSCWADGLLQRPSAGSLATQMDVISGQM